MLCDLVHDAEAPIVFTGAIRPASAPGAYGPANTVDAISVAVPSSHSPFEGRSRAAAPAEPVALAIAKPMLVRITRVSRSPKEPVRSAITAATAAQERPVTSAMPANRRIEARSAVTTQCFGRAL